MYHVAKQDAEALPDDDRIVKEFEKSEFLLERAKGAVRRAESDHDDDHQALTRLWWLCAPPPRRAAPVRPPDAPRGLPAVDALEAPDD